MCLHVAAGFFHIELLQRRIVRPGACDQHVIDGRRQLVEEPFQPVEIRCVEGGYAGPKLITHALETVAAPRREDDTGSLSTSKAGCLEPDSGAAADNGAGLPLEF
jgi:hypothetical protein